MPDWVEVDNDLTLEDLVARPDPTRSPGLHLSQIYGDIMRTMDPDRFSGEGPMAVYMAVGLAFEDLIAEALRSRVLGWDKPGEFTVDGITMSPDGFGGDDFEGVDELKVTWCSSREHLENPKLDRYHMQGKGYARALGVNRVRYRVLWVAGDYQPPVPQFRTYIYTYTDRELEDNWTLMVQHARDRGWLPPRKETIR